MATTTNEIKLKIQKQITNKFKPVIQKLLDEGVDKGRIIDVIHRHVEVKTKQYYQNRIENRSIYHILVDDLRKKSADSKAEKIFYFLLEDNDVPFKFQYPVGPYRIDYLIGESIAIELDGPAHQMAGQKPKDDKKDKYLNKMGYQVLRIPLYLVAIDEKAVIEGIKELI